MAAGNWLVVDTAKTYLWDAVLDHASASWKMALLLSTSNIALTSDLYGNVTNEHANANGYLTGGVAVSLTNTPVGSTTTIGQAANAEWTAAGGSIIARWALIYLDATVAGIVKPILSYCLLDTAGGGTDVTTPSGVIFAVKPNALGILTLTGATA